MIKVKSRKYAWSSDMFGVIDGFSFHNMHLTLPGLHATQYFSPPIRRDGRSYWSETTVKLILVFVYHTVYSKLLSGLILKDNFGVFEAHTKNSYLPRVQISQRTTPNAHLLQQNRNYYKTE